MNFKHLCYKKIGENKGRPRIWFQGKRLESCRMHPGSRIQVDYSENEIRVYLSESGSRVVSSKKEQPIIDLSNSRIGEIFKGVDRVRAVFKDGEIIITIHPDDMAKKERFARLLDKLQNDRPLNVGSVSHGGGILDHALHQGLSDQGVRSRLSFALEIDENYLETSLQNNPIWDDNSIAIEAPMQEVETDLLPKTEILVAGIPCTGASLAGRSKNKLKCAEEHDSAGALFLSFLNIIKAVNPALVVMENVVPYSNTASMTVIRSVLSGWGYKVEETVLGGNDFGALEDRQRMCMVAVTEGLSFDMSMLQPVREKEPNLAAVMEDVPDDDPSWREFSYLREKEMRDIANGKGFKMQLVDGNAPKVGTIGRSYAKCRQTEPFIVHTIYKKLLRLLTVAEHAAVKTVPVGLVKGCSVTRAHELLGQGVVHAAFVALGRTMADQFNNLLLQPINDVVEQTADIENDQFVMSF